MLPKEISRRRFDVHEYHRMGEIGLLTEDDRIELIRGEIVQMNPIGISHMNCVTRLTHLMVERSQGRFIVSVQNPVRLNESSEPEPDIALIAGGPRTKHPSPEDTFLVIEVSDTTLDYDRNIKLPLYAETGIREVWIVDIKGEKIAAYSEPSAEGYKTKSEFSAGEEVVSTTLDGLKVSVDEVLA